MLTHWPPITSIFFLTEAMYCNFFRSNYLRNTKYFHNFLFHFLNLDSIFNIFKNKMTLLADAFFNWRTRKWNYLVKLSEKQKMFSEFSFALILRSILNIFKNKMTLIADVLLNLRTPKTWLDKCLTSPVSDDPLTSNMVNEPKHFSKLKRQDRTFTIFIDPSKSNSDPKNLSEWYPKS